MSHPSNAWVSLVLDLLAILLLALVAGLWAWGQPVPEGLALLTGVLFGRQLPAGGVGVPLLLTERVRRGVNPLSRMRESLERGE